MNVLWKPCLIRASNQTKFATRNHTCIIAQALSMFWKDLEHTTWFKNHPVLAETWLEIWKSKIIPCPSEVELLHVIHHALRQNQPIWTMSSQFVSTGTDVKLHVICLNCLENLNLLMICSLFWHFCVFSKIMYYLRKTEVRNAHLDLSCLREERHAWHTGSAAWLSSTMQWPALKTRRVHQTGFRSAAKVEIDGYFWYLIRLFVSHISQNWNRICIWYVKPTVRSF